jgi:hypothetical protein
MSSTYAPTPSRTALVGNRLVLAGAVLYLLEWVAIIAGNIGVPLGAAASATHVMAGYSGHANTFGWAAGWFSVVLLGRVVLMIGLRSALADSGRPQRLMDIAVAAMAVSVTLEVVTYALVAGTSWAAGQPGAQAATRVLDAASFEMNVMIYGPLGVSLLCAGAAMLRSTLFGRVLPALALVAGFLSTLIGLALASPSLVGAEGALSSAALLMWIWMLWTGVVLWRAPSS